MIDSKTGMKTCLIYCRVSDQDQLKGKSLEVQENLCRKWATENKYDVKGVYIDEAKSGTRIAGRENFEDSIIHCQREHIDAILVIDTDRFARNEHDHFAVKAILSKLGTGIIAINQPQIDDSAEGMLMETILVAINAFLSRLTGRKVKKTLEAKWEAGWFPGWAPLGYQNVNIGTEDNPNRIIKIDPVAGPLIQWAFHQYSKGRCSLLKLTKVLQKKGLRTRNGKPIAHSTIHQILTNPFYYGLMRWNGQEKTGNHDPLISPELFSLCQAMAAKHRNFIIRERKHDFLLRGFVFCARCGRRYTAEYHYNDVKLKNRGGRIAYYHCQKKTPCNAPYIEVNDLENQVVEHLSDIRFTKGFTDALTLKVKHYLKDLDKEDDKTRRGCLNKRQGIINKRKRLEKRLLDEELGIDRGTYRRLHDELQADIDNIDIELTKLESGRKFDFDLLEEVLALTRNIPKTYKQASELLKKSYLNFFFEKILVDDKKVVDTVYSPLVQELINQQAVILRPNWLLG